MEGLAGPLAGVIVGAALGFGFGLWHDWLRWRREDAVRWKKEQRAVYTRFLAAAQGCIDAAPRAEHWLRLSQDDELDGEQVRVATRSARDAHARFLEQYGDFQAAREDLMLIAPESVRSSATVAWVTLTLLEHSLSGQRFGESTDDFRELLTKANARRDDFREAARRDLGVTE